MRPGYQQASGVPCDRPSEIANEAVTCLMPRKEQLDCPRLILTAGASLADPNDPEGDPKGERLLHDASDEVAAVLRRYGAAR